jgi:hypothetical protein
MLALLWFENSTTVSLPEAWVIGRRSRGVANHSWKLRAAVAGTQSLAQVTEENGGYCKDEWPYPTVTRMGREH